MSQNKLLSKVYLRHTKISAVSVSVNSVTYICHYNQEDKK